MSGFNKLFFMGLMLFFVTQGCNRKNTSHEFQINNKTDTNIVQCTLKEDYSKGRTQVIKNLKPGEMKASVFNDCRIVCSAIISIEFTDGETLTYPPVGYITYGWSRKYSIDINENKSMSFKTIGSNKTSVINPVAQNVKIKN